MLIWINGTFGVGKTQTAHELQRKLPGSVVSDPELLGFGIQRMYPAALREDFQDTPWWAPTVTEILADLAALHPGPVIVPMTLADPHRHRQIIGGLRASGVDVRHAALLASEATVHQRLRGRLEGRGSWAADQFRRVDERLREPEFATHIETDGLSLPDVVERVGKAVGIDVRYSASEKAFHPFRRLGVQLRHVRR